MVDVVSQLGIGVLLARLLVPSDFGVMALAFIVLSVIRPFGDLGMAGAVVQRRELTERHIRTAFTFSLIFGIAVAAIMVAISPLAALATRQPMVAPVLRWLSLGFAISGTSIVADALLRRRLDFKRRFIINTGSYVIGYGGVGVTLALLGYGVWSLVWAGLSQTVLMSILVLASVRHPKRPMIARPELDQLLNFGVGTSASAFVNFLARSGDNFVVGRVMGAENLGLYSRAYSLMNLPFTYAATAVSSVLFPALSEVQHEPERLRRAHLLLTRLVAVVSAPAMATMGIVAPHLIVGVYGPKWTGAIVPLQVLSAAGYVRALYHISGVVAQSAGRVYGELRNQIVYAVLVLVGAVLGTRFGLAGVSIGVAAAIGYMFVATAQLALSATATSWRTYVRAQIFALAIGAITGTVALAVRLALERQQLSSGPIAAAVLAAAALPAALGILWVLGDADFGPVLRNFPSALGRLSARVALLRRAT